MFSVKKEGEEKREGDIGGGRPMDKGCSDEKAGLCPAANFIAFHYLR